MDQDLIYQVLAVVSEIPKGKVASYKQIAILVGREKNARLVGKILSVSSLYGDYPCHRVVNGVGRLVPGWTMQEELLKDESISFKSNGYVDMKKHQWNIK